MRFHVIWMAWGHEAIGHDYINFFFKRLQMDGSSPLGIHFGRRNGNVVVCRSSQIALGTATLRWRWTTLIPLSSSLTKPFRAGPGHSLLPCPLLPGFDLSISLQALAMTRVPQLLHAAPSLWNIAHAIYFSRMLSPRGLPLPFSTLAPAITASKKHFFFFLTLPPWPLLCCSFTLCCRFFLFTLVSSIGTLLGADRVLFFFYPHST